MVYLVIVSLVLHLVSFFVMIILYQKIESSQPPDTGRTLKEMEDMLISYTTEIKENNEKLARRINDMDTAASKPAPLTENLRHAQADEQKDKRAAETAAKQDTAADADYSAYNPPLPEETAAQEAAFISSETSRVLSMHQQGFSEADIARQLGIGAGEVHLLLKFYK
ncbi:DUF6115 domain-containing protein [Salisediminibacterium halotolerans]|uniref:DUF6115 domain-containing protein n=2 Tax=Salisediminibacterium halotolerans TaxID=517425 RepID=UPI000EAE7292|nr:hypothetical protein [Salisediminibacterium halotolerans]RLJ74192.1 hypothetical protein BCL39_1480 [Actinophytocola xinjiangensis]RPE87715.1 hypothetical protein EDD67_1451 [Salisediminibacterium halotolerans]TWG35029.1 hypothetical protein BCL52_1477 [Salisediminibacterium halotolerans]GEL06684.1 hypothetical protein SHA02_01000 [Salisediminibacterium halotolerans]